MIQQQLVTDERMNGKVYNFIEFKKKKPFFKKPIKITIGNPMNDTYYMVKNVVYKGNQILALKKEQDPNTIVLVKAKIVDGELKYISMLSDDFLEDIGMMIEGNC